MMLPKRTRETLRGNENNKEDVLSSNRHRREAAR